MINGKFPLDENKQYIKRKIQINKNDISNLMKSYDDPSEYFNVEENIKLS